MGGPEGVFELAGDELQLRDHQPQPSNLWIRHSLCGTRLEGSAWIDLTTFDLGGGSEGSGTGGRAARPIDLVYVSPPGPEGVGEASVAIEKCSRIGIPTLLQVIVGEGHPQPVARDDTMIVYDALSVLIQERFDVLAEIDRGATVLWPVVAGLTDEPDLVAAGLESLSASGVSRVVPIAVDLAPSAGRCLIDLYGERLFNSVFHTREADLLGVVRACAEHALQGLPRRSSLPSGREFERRLAAELGMIGELLLALGESPADVQDFFRAARWVEETQHDVRGLAREGNLAVVPWLSERPRSVIEELAAGRRGSTLLASQVERLTA